MLWCLVNLGEYCCVGDKGDDCECGGGWDDVKIVRRRLFDDERVDGVWIFYVERTV